MLIVGAVEQPVRAGTDVTSGRAGRRWGRSDAGTQRIGTYRAGTGQGGVGHLGVEFGW